MAVQGSGSEDGFPVLVPAVIMHIWGPWGMRWDGELVRGMMCEGRWCDGCGVRVYSDERRRALHASQNALDRGVELDTLQERLLLCSA